MWQEFMIAFQALPWITQAFIIVICALTLLFAFPFYNNRTVALGPTVLTMSGIFGCFLGIALGLMEFQTSDVQGSVPALVEGIKTAFWASVAGVGGALVMKLRYLVGGPPRPPVTGATEGATVDDLATHLSRLHQSIAGDDDSTLISQIRLLRQENRDRLTALATSLDNYIDQMAQSNAEALIEALNDVIKDFNLKISEQFGENFKQLNEAVGRLLDWQEKYRTQLNQLISSQEKTTINMTSAAERYAQILEHTNAFATTADRLRTTISTLENQRGQIEQSLKSLGTLLKSAGENLPKIEIHIVEMTKQIESGVRANNDQIHATIQGITTGLQTSHAEMKRQIVDLTEKVNQDVNSHMKLLAENTRNQVIALDKALSDELTKSITTLGEHLTALSRRFVDDYTPLTAKLRELVQAASRVQ